MDSQHATLVGREHVDNGAFIILDHITDKTEHNDEQDKQHKFFKEITMHMQNAEEIHVTGTGVAQEQFIHYLAATPQFKNTIAKESTSNKMSDEHLLEFIKAKFN